MGGMNTLFQGDNVKIAETELRLMQRLEEFDKARQAVHQELLNMKKLMEDDNGDDNYVDYVGRFQTPNTINFISPEIR